MSIKKIVSGVLVLAMLASSAPVMAVTEDEVAETDDNIQQDMVKPEDDLTEDTVLQPEKTDDEQQAEEPEKPEFIPPEVENAQLTQVHIAYMNGVGGGKFSPSNTITWAQVATIIYNLLVDQSCGSKEYDYSDLDSSQWYYTPVTVLASKGILPPDGSEFNPNESITRQDFVKLIVTVAGADVQAQCSFTDVDECSEYYVYIATAASRGWISGFPDGGFHPDGNLTRGQTAVIINNMLGRSADLEVLNNDAQHVRTFTDVEEGRYYYFDIIEATVDHEYTYGEEGEVWTSYKKQWPVTYIIAGDVYTEYVYEGLKPENIPSKTSSGNLITCWYETQSGNQADPKAVVVEPNTSYSFTAYWAPKLISAHVQYVEGFSDGTFGPDMTLTRAQTCQMLYNLLDSKDKGGFESGFIDVHSSDWYYAAVTTLASLRIIEGGGEFRPEDKITRAEFAGIIAALIPAVSGESTFSDVDETNEYFSAIITAAAKGWLNGYPDGTFRPDNTLTRAEAVTAFNKMLGRNGDKANAAKMDTRYTFLDVPRSHWAYNAVMEAATTHTYTVSGSSETWSEYSHKTGTLNWENSDSVVNGAKIITYYKSNYTGDYTHNYNIDYSTADKENFVSGYSSNTGYLVWVSRACQKVYLFTGYKGNWKLSKTFLCATGKMSSPTPECVTTTTYKQTGWFTDHYTVAPVVRFMSGSGFAFHSRLYYPGTNILSDATIGMPASAGCVRMLTPDVTYLYNYLPSGTKVIVSK